jgi:arylsulfatase A-like enzyme
MPPKADAVAIVLSRILFVVLALLGTFEVGASVLFEPFANAIDKSGSRYAAGAPLVQQVNAAGSVWYSIRNIPNPSALGSPVIVPESLSYPGLPASTGGSVKISPSAGIMGRLSLDFRTVTGSVYFSFLLKVSDLSGLDESGAQNNYFAAFNDNTGDQNATLVRAATRIYTKRDRDGFRLGISKNSNRSADWVFDTVRRNTNEVLLIVGSYDYDHHAAHLWINPPESSFRTITPPPPVVTAAGGSDLNRNGVRSFVLGCRTEPPPGCLVDELRIGTTWSAVTGGLIIDPLPESRTQDAGAAIQFSVKTAGSPPFRYQWRKGGVNLAISREISGSSTPTLSLNKLDARMAGDYSVVVTDAHSSVTSSVVRLIVNDPAIRRQPVNQVVRAGANARFQVDVAGARPLKYQWYKDGAALHSGGNISGVNSEVLSVHDVHPNDTGRYFARVTNRAGSVNTSQNASLYITDASVNGSRPNIIFILTDDMGYGELGVFYQNSRAPGLPREKTPNLDSFASEGMQLRMHYCSAPVCAPSRASLLLGVHQGHANVRDQQWDKALAKNHTLANVLQEAGYATAAIGKWGLGGDDVGGSTPADWAAYPTKRGFDYFFGYERHGDGHDHYPKEAPYSNRSKECYDGATNITPVLDKCYTTDLFTARAKKWVQDQHGAHPKQPLFLYLAFDTPHAVYELPTQPYPAGGGLRGGMQWLGKPGHMINTASGTVDSYFHPDYASATWDNDHNPATSPVQWPETFRRFATGVRRVDDAVGDLMKLLKDLKMDDNTLVVFTSDNGPTVEDYTKLTPRYAANFFETFGPLDGVKRDGWEGGIREPTLARWPGKIPAGGINLIPSQFHDWMATFTDLAGLPSPARCDGVSLAPTLMGTGRQRPSTIYVEYNDPFKTPDYLEFEPGHRGRTHNQLQVIGVDGLQGVRYDISSQSADFEIYDVLRDPKESRNLALDPAYASLQQKMKDRVLELHRPDPTAPRPYDNELIPAILVPSTKPGVEWSAYKSVFPWVPELTAEAPSSSGKIDRPTLEVSPRDVNFALLFKGYVVAPADGDYRFSISTDTGALLRIHDTTVIDADYGYSSETPISGGIKLMAGLHPFRLYYVRRAGPGAPDLLFRWSGPGFSTERLPKTAFRHGG